MPVADDWLVRLVLVEVLAGVRVRLTEGLDRRHLPGHDGSTEPSTGGMYHTPNGVHGKRGAQANSETIVGLFTSTPLRPLFPLDCRADLAALAAISTCLAVGRSGHGIRRGGRDVAALGALDREHGGALGQQQPVSGRPRKVLPHLLRGEGGWRMEGGRKEEE